VSGTDGGDESDGEEEEASPEGDTTQMPREHISLESQSELRRHVPGSMQA
jgi:hypothetical protein